MGQQKSGFFNSSGGDRVYSAADFASYFGSLVSNGIFTLSADNLRVEAAASMNVLVRPGGAFINGYNYQNTEDLQLTISTADGINSRIDRVVIRWSQTDREIVAAVKAGVASASPVPPALTRTSNVYELGIADIAVGRAVTSIVAGDITDTRLVSALCGSVNSLIGAVYE